MPGPALLDRRLLVVTGKGGVGKSSMSAALALLAARRGQRVLVCEVNAHERVAPMLGALPSGPEIRQVRPRLFTVNVQPREAMREYGIMTLKFRSLYDAVFENRVTRYFLRAIPSLSELVMLGKILYEAKAEERGRLRWDLVVLDAPATGHAVQLLGVPAALLETLPPGPLRRDAQWMQDLLIDPARTSLSIVTLPEEMPVNEAIELDQVVRGQLRMPRGALIVNALPERRFSPAEAERLPGLAAEPPPLGPAAAAGRVQALRAEQAARHLARAREAIDLPALTVPLLARDAWDAGAVEAIAAALEPQL
ncbi:MAG TPA: ArsA-related P-loop ATPase [Anaeromyxobacteraceae bacterium]